MSCSYSRINENEDLAQQEYLIKGTAATLYSGGSDTVGTHSNEPRPFGYIHKTDVSYNLLVHYRPSKPSRYSKTRPWRDRLCTAIWKPSNFWRGREIAIYYCHMHGSNAMEGHSADRYTSKLYFVTSKVIDVSFAGFPHLLTKDDTFNGYRIPKGSFVIANTW